MDIDHATPEQLHRLTAGAGALVPWTVFLAILVVGGGSIGSVGALTLSAAFSLIVIGAPCLAVLLALRNGVAKASALAALTLTAAIAAALVVETDDAQAGLAIFIVPYVAVPSAIVLWIVRLVVESRTPPSSARTRDDHLAPASHRLAALAIDTILLGLVLVVPLRMLSHRDLEVLAVVLGVAVGSAYLGGLVALRGGTFGHAVLGLVVADAATGGRVGPARALLRGAIIVLEVVVAKTCILAAPAIAELVVTAKVGRSLTDRALRTAVIVAPRR